jgi:hypothetical protein
MMNCRSALILLLIVSILPGNIGCGVALLAGGAAAGAGSYAYVTGELKATEAVSLENAYQAAQQAMSELEFTVTNKQKDAFYAEVNARRASGKKIKVKLDKESNSVTRIRIRVGTFGDESMSHQILERIKKHI